MVIAPMIVLAAFTLGGCSKKTVAPAPPGGVYRSESAGASFEQSVNIDGQEGQYVASYSLAGFDRASFDPHLIYVAAGAQGLIVSKNNGQSWVNVPTPLIETLDVVVLTNKIVVSSGTDANGQGFIVRSLDEGQSWQSVFTIPLATKQSGQLNILGGSGLPLSVVVTLERDPFNGEQVYAATNLGTIFVGEQSAKTWRTLHRVEPRANDPVPNAESAGIGRLVPSPFEKNEVLAVTNDHRLLRINGDKEETINVPLTLGDVGVFGLHQNRKVDAVAFIPGFSDALMVSGDKGVLVTRDKGKSWVDLQVPIDTAQTFATTIAVVSPTNVNRILVAVRDVVYRSEDGGRTWNTAALGLTNFAINSLLIDPSNAANVLAITVPSKS